MVYLNVKKGRIHIKCPRVPNFIMIDGNYKPLDYFTEEELKIISKEWIFHLLGRRKELLKDANKRRRKKC